jgi:hypothetical protein
MGCSTVYEAWRFGVVSACKGFRVVWMDWLDLGNGCVLVVYGRGSRVEIWFDVEVWSAG